LREDARRSGGAPTEEKFSQDKRGGGLPGLAIEMKSK